MTKFELNTFTFYARSKSLFIDNAVLVPIAKPLLFTIRNAVFIGSLDTNPCKFRHYDTSNFSLLVNGKRVPSEGLSLDMDHEKTSVMGYRTLFGGPGINHLNSGLQITHDLYMNG